MTEKEGKKVKVTTIIIVTTSNYFVNVFFLQFYQSKSLYDIVLVKRKKLVTLYLVPIHIFTMGIDSFNFLSKLENWKRIFGAK